MIYSDSCGIKEPIVKEQKVHVAVLTEHIMAQDIQRTTLIQPSAITIKVSIIKTLRGQGHREIVFRPIQQSANILVLQQDQQLLNLLKATALQRIIFINVPAGPTLRQQSQARHKLEPTLTHR